MAIFVIFGNQKGGVGKSQCTILAATALAQSPFNKKVLVVDFDKQESVKRMRDLEALAFEGTGIDPNQSFAVQTYSIKTFLVELSQIEDDYDYVFFDAAGKLDNDLHPSEQEITPLLLICDVLIVPVIAGNHVLNSTTEFLYHAKTIQTKRFNDPNFSKRPLSIHTFINMDEQGAPQRDLESELVNITNDETALCARLPVDLKNYLTFRKADTVQSLYNPKSKTAASKNFAEWLDAIFYICGN